VTIPPNAITARARPGGDRRPRWLAALPVCLLLAPRLALAQATREDPHPEAHFAALVIGVSADDHMPKQVELDFAHADAATAARVLEESAPSDAVSARGIAPGRPTRPAPRPSASERWNVDLLARTDFPIDVGLAVDVETPQRVRFGLGVGVVPRPYVQAINEVCVAAGCYDEATATLIDDSIRGALTLHPVLGFRPLPRAGFVVEAGLKIALLGGSNTPAGLVAGLTGEELPEAETDTDRTLRAAATLGLVTAKVGWVWEPKRAFVVRLDVGGAFTVFSDTTILAPEGSRAPRVWDPLTAAGEAYLDSTLQTYVHTPTISLGIGWRGL
jgi:hypothetical protein